LERVKVDLSLRTDFNLIDTFRIFDTQGKGWVTPDELRSGLLAVFNLSVTGREIHLYMSRYDRDRDGRLRYSEFCDSFLPTDPFHASLLAKKAPLQVTNIQSSQIRRDLLFYPETRELLETCWRMHFDHEKEAEMIRQQIASVSPRFDCYQCFQLIDSRSDGQIDPSEVKELLIRHAIYVSEKEICALIDRYDRTKDGRISYTEFLEEL
jgi:Ca2+-binding EF-hand superfamily protein